MATPAKLKVPTELQAKLDGWLAQVKTDAFDVMQVQLPEKILKLNDTITSMSSDATHLFSKAHYFSSEDLGIDTTVYPGSSNASADPPASSEAPPPKKRKAASAPNGEPEEAKKGDDAAHVFTGQLKTCEYMLKAHDAIREEWHDMIRMLDAIKMFINMQFPKIEDGDTFGQSVQEEVHQEVVRSQESAYSMLATPYTFHSARGDLASKLVRFPNVEDHKLALREHDRRSFYRLMMQWTDTRNMYATVFDLLSKNMEKISKPKSGNQMGSYG